MLSRQLGRVGAPLLRAHIAPLKIGSSLPMPLKAVFTQHTAGVSTSASLHYTMRDLHAKVYGRSKLTSAELGVDYGAGFEESHNHPWLWLISFASTGCMMWMMWNNHSPKDKERIHTDFFNWLRSWGIPIAHAEAAVKNVAEHTAKGAAMPAPAAFTAAAASGEPAPARSAPAAGGVPIPAAAAAALAAVSSAPIPEDDPPLAGFLRRFFAWMIDSGVTNIFMFVLRESVARIRPNAESPLDTLAGALGASVLANVLFDLFCLLQWEGKSPGKWLLSLRTVRQGDFATVDRATALKSAAARGALLVCPMFDVVPLIFSSSCREDGLVLHNWVAGTIVIDERAPIEYDEE